MPTIIPVLVDLDAAEFGANVPVDPGGEVMVLLETGGEPLLLPEPEVSLESEGVLNRAVHELYRNTRQIIKRTQNLRLQSANLRPNPEHYSN